MSNTGNGKGADLALVMKRYTDAILAKDIPAWVDLWAEEGVFEHPYSPPGYKKSIEGKPAISEYMSGFPERFDVKSFTVVGLVQNEAGTEAFVEIKAEATAIPTGRPYNQHYVGYMRVNEAGKFLLYRDFWNPLVAMEAFGGAQALNEALKAGGN